MVATHPGKRACRNLTTVDARRLPAIVVWIVAALSVAIFATATAGARETGISSAPPAVAAAVANVPENPSKFHVFLLMGQSNMAGYGGVVATDPYLPGDKDSVPGILVLDGQGTEASAKPVESIQWRPGAHRLHLHQGTAQFGLGMDFAKAYLKQHPGVTVGLIPCAWGGAGIDMLKKGTPIFNNAMERMEFAKKQGVIKGVLWHQGESDTVTADLVNSYGEKLRGLIIDIRIRADNPHLPFLIGNLAEFYGECPDHKPRLALINRLRGILRDIGTEGPDTAFVPSSGLVPADKNMVHFNRASLVIFGQRYAETLASLQELKKTPAPGENPMFITLDGKSVAPVNPLEGGYIRYVKSPALRLMRTAQVPSKGTIMLLPGGGYGCLAIDHEGTRTGGFLNARGFDTAILEYTVAAGPQTRDLALADALKAWRLIKTQAGMMKLSAARFGVMGYSAGGHLAARLTASLVASEQPDDLILIYPAYLDEKTNTVKPPANPSARLFALIAVNDKPQWVGSCKAFANSWQTDGGRVRLELLKDGGHGFGMKPGLPGEAEKWPAMLEDFLRNPQPVPTTIPPATVPFQ